MAINPLYQAARSSRRDQAVEETRAAARYWRGASVWVAAVRPVADDADPDLRIRTYISQEFLGYLFDLDASNVCRNMARMRPVLAQVCHIPERRMKASTEDVATLFLTEPTHLPAARPRNAAALFSGKKKCHTLKNQWSLSTSSRHAPGHCGGIPISRGQDA